jgi:hypothetical protein
MTGRVPGGWPTLLAVGIVGVALVALALLEPRLGTPGRGDAPPTVHSARPGGTRALALWLRDLGYLVQTNEGRPFAPDGAVDVLFVLEPSEEYADADVDAALAWVERGGTLVLATGVPSLLTGRLGVEPRPDPAPDPLRPRQPGLLGPVRAVEADAEARLSLGEGGWVPLLGPAGGDPVAATRRLGAGRVYALASAAPLSNGRIGAADNAHLDLRLLAHLPPDATVQFDEYHHGLTEHGTLFRRLVVEPWGWALLVAAAAVFGYLALAGRRFGRARPDPREAAPRGRGEYVATLADALRRGRRADWLRRAYAAQLRRALARRFHVAADLPPNDFAAALALRRPEATALADPLARLEAPAGLDDASLLDLMRRADRLRARLLEARP